MNLNNAYIVYKIQQKHNPTERMVTIPEATEKVSYVLYHIDEKI